MYSMATSQVTNRALLRKLWPQLTSLRMGQCSRYLVQLNLVFMVCFLICTLNCTTNPFQYATCMGLCCSSDCLGIDVLSTADLMHIGVLLTADVMRIGVLLTADVERKQMPRHLL